MNVDDCARCRDYFLTHPLIQAEVKHELRLFGEQSARSKMIEIMEPVHEIHEEENINEPA